MIDSLNCQPPSSTLTWQKQHLGNVHHSIVGILKEKKDEVLKLEYLGSDKFWDESDLFSINGEPVLVYRLKDDESVEVGEKVLVTVTDIFWDTKHEQRIPFENCAWTMRVFNAGEIKPYTFVPMIEMVEFTKNFTFLFFSIATVVILFFWSLSLKRGVKVKK